MTDETGAGECADAEHSGEERLSWERTGADRLAPERFDIARQRRALRRLADSTDFLRSEEGLAFLSQLRGILAPSAVAEARRLGAGGGWTCLDEAVSTAVVGLTSDGGRVAKYAAASEGEPWAYLNACLVRWMRAQLGSRCSPLDLVTPPMYSPGPVDTGLTPLAEVVEHTFAELSAHVRPDQRQSLRRLLRWLALNPPQRSSYERDDRLGARRCAPEFDDSQIAAVVNIAWGGRPRRAQTSLFGAVLIDPDFRTSDSPSHARALVRFARTMRQPGLGGAATLLERRAA